MKIKKEKRQKVKKETKVSLVETLKTYAKDFAFDYKPLVYDLTKNAEECKSATSNTCWRPDIYLNNDRSCDNCILYENCACSSRRLAVKKSKKQ